MSDFYLVAVSVVAISCAVGSMVVLGAALLKMRRESYHRVVHVTIDGRRFEVEDVDPRDIDAILAGVKKVAQTQARPRALADAGD